MPLQVKFKSSEEDKHSYDVNTLVSHNGDIYSGADDGKIIKWNETLKKLAEVQAHPCSIYSLAALGDTIYSCSNDGSVKSWTLDLQAKATLMQDECEFWKLVASDGVVYVGDDQGAIRTIIDDKPKARYEILEGIKDLAISGNMLYSGKDIDVTITSLGNGPKPTFATRKVMQGRAPLTLAGNKFIFVDSPSATGFHVHESDAAANFKPITSVQNAHAMIINALSGCKDQKDDETDFYSGSWDKTIKKWKVIANNCQLIGTIEVGLVVNTLLVDNNQKGSLYAGLADGYLIKVE